MQRVLFGSLLRCLFFSFLSAPLLFLLYRLFGVIRGSQLFFLGIRQFLVLLPLGFFLLGRQRFGLLVVFARGAAPVRALRSTTSALTPRVPSSIAAARPTGPAPMMSTSVSIMAQATLFSIAPIPSTSHRTTSPVCRNTCG